MWAASAIVEDVERGGEGRCATSIGEFHAEGTACVLSQRRQRRVSASARRRRAVRQDLKVGRPGAGYRRRLAERQRRSA